MEGTEKELNILKKRRSKLLSYVRGEEFYQINWDKLYDENTGEIKSLEFFKELARLDSEIKNYQELYVRRIRMTKTTLSLVIFLIIYILQAVTVSMTLFPT